VSRSRLQRAPLANWPHGPVFPSSATTGATLPGGLTTVGTGYLTSGTGWAWNAGEGLVNITGANAVFSGYRVLGGIFVDANGVTVENSSTAAGLQVSGAGTTVSNCDVTDTEFGFNLNPGSTGTTIENCTIHGLDGATNRMGYGVYAAPSSDPSLLVTGCKIYWMKDGISTPPAGGYTVTGCWIADFGFAAGDHSDGIYINGTATGLISGNTILNNLGQTDAIFVNNSSNTVGNFTIKGNLLGGGDYAFYGGATPGFAFATDVVFSDNYFTTQFGPDCGVYGPAIYWATAGNTWSGNQWLDGASAGQPVAHP
jgi:hypothetical protein